MLESLNEKLFLVINAGANEPTWILNCAIGAAEILIYVVPLFFLVMWLWSNSIQREVLIRASVVAFLGVGINQIIGVVWMHPRPSMIGLGHTLVQHAADSSSPSDHVTVLSAVTITLLLARAVVPGLLFLLAGIGVAWARIFLGVHFPFDMIGAVIVAIGSYIVVIPAWGLFGRKITSIIEALYRKVMAGPINRGLVEW